MTEGRTIRTPENEAGLLEAVSRLGSVTAACNLLGISRTAVYDWRRADAAFDAKLSAAQDQGTDALEDEAVRRALEGTQEAVYFEGKVVGHQQRYSDTLLMFTLKGRRPEKWKDRTATELTGKDGGPVQVENVREELARRIARLSAGASTGGDSGGADGS